METFEVDAGLQRKAHADTVRLLLQIANATLANVRLGDRLEALRILASCGYGRAPDAVREQWEDETMEGEE